MIHVLILTNDNLEMCVCTSQRRCCACWGVWRRWERWASALCSLVTAAWQRGGTARRAETETAAPCKPPASHGPPPSPWPHRLNHTHTHNISNSGKSFFPVKKISMTKTYFAYKNRLYLHIFGIRNVLHVTSSACLHFCYFWSVCIFKEPDEIV